MKRKLIQVYYLLMMLVTLQAFAEEIVSFNNDLVDAANLGYLEEVISLVNKGYFVDSKGSFGVTPLMRASWNGNQEIVKFLLSAGADLDMADPGGASALHIATRRGSFEVVKILLDGKANLNLKDASGSTPLMKALSSNQKNIATLLLQRGANIEEQNQWKQTALILAAQKQYWDIVDLILQKINIQNLNSIEKQKLLKIAETKGNVKIITLLQNSEPIMPIISKEVIKNLSEVAITNSHILPSEEENIPNTKKEFYISVRDIEPEVEKIKKVKDNLNAETKLNNPIILYPIIKEENNNESNAQTLISLSENLADNQNLNREKFAKNTEPTTVEEDNEEDAEEVNEEDGEDGEEDEDEKDEELAENTENAQIDLAENFQKAIIISENQALERSRNLEMTYKSKEPLQANQEVKEASVNRYVKEKIEPTNMIISRHKNSASIGQNTRMFVVINQVRNINYINQLIDDFKRKQNSEDLIVNLSNNISTKQITSLEIHGFKNKNIANKFCQMLNKITQCDHIGESNEYFQDHSTYSHEVYWLQLASAKSQTRIKEIVNGLKERSPQIFQNYSQQLYSTESNNKVINLRYGPYYDRSQAESECTKLLDSEVACTVTKFRDGTQAKFIAY